MRRSLIALAFVLGLPSSLAAQEARPTELGMRAGVNILFDGETLVNLAGGAPGPFGGALGGNTAVHVAFFPSEQVMIEPALSFAVLTNGATFTNLTFTAQVAYLFQGASANSAYAGVSGGFNLIDIDVFDDTDFGAGGILGYRFLPKENVAIRVEGAYRRWFDYEISEVDAAVILAILL